MAENYNNNEQVPTGADAPAETTDRGIFDFLKKDDAETTKPVVEEESKFANEFDEKVKVSEPVEYKEVEEEKHHDTLLDKFHQADDDKSSSSCSSSDEEDDEEKKKRKKEKKEKKGLKEKLVEKLPGHKEEDTNVPIETPHKDEVAYSKPSDSVPPQVEDVEKKGLLDKIKDKISGDKKVDDHPDIATPVSTEPSVVVEGEEKKGFMDKIKDKLPGFGTKDTEDKKDHD